jgi:hypothetical protein
MSELANQMDLCYNQAFEQAGSRDEACQIIKEDCCRSTSQKYEFRRQLLKVRLILEEATRAKKQLEQ